MEINRSQFKDKHKNFGVTTSIMDETEIDDRPVVLHCAIESPVYSSSGITKGWEKAGYRVAQLNWQPIRFEETTSGLHARILLKAKFEQPEIIFLHIQTEGVLDTDFCKQLTTIAPTVLYTFDCRDKERSQWMYDLAPYLSLICFASQRDVDSVKALGYENSFVVQSTCDYTIYRPLNIPKSQPEIVFIGGDYSTSNLNFDRAEERKEIISFLYKEFPDNFSSFGMGQRQNRYINPQEEVLIYNRAKFAICQSNYNLEKYCSDRVWRSAGCGCLPIVKMFPNMYRAIPTSIPFFMDHQQLKGIINYYLDNPDKYEIAQKQVYHDVTTQHTWYNRVLQIKDCLAKVLVK